LYVSNTINGIPVSYLSNLYTNTGTDQYARNYELLLSGVVFSNYLIQGSYINSLQAYDKSLSGNIYANYFSQGASINTINNTISTLQSSSGVDQYARNYELSLSGIVYTNYFIQGASINSINNTISTLQGSSGVDQYSRFYESIKLLSSRSINQYS
jgi:hypothetical protein